MVEKSGPSAAEVRNVEDLQRVIKDAASKSQKHNVLLGLFNGYDSSEEVI